jgi:hypothetical protein
LEERILRYADNKFNQIKILILITLFAVVVLNPYAYEIVKAILK